MELFRCERIRNLCAAAQLLASSHTRFVSARLHQMFRRKPQHQPPDQIAAFWQWWPTAAQRFEAAIETGDYGLLADDMSAHVHAIDDGLQWELSKGDVSMHALCVTPAGNPELRALATRWRLAAPPSTATWEYRSARAADPAAMTNLIDFGGHETSLADARFGIHVNDERQEIDLVVFHPVFADLPDDARRQLMFLIVDWTLGEQGVERWIGSIETSLTEPDAPLHADALVDVTNSLAERHAAPSWSLFEGTTPEGLPVLAMAMRPLKPVDYPLFDLLGTVRHSFADRTSAGFPQPATLDQLREFEASLEAVSPEHSRLAAVVTSDGVRTFHIYCDSQSPARSDIDAWLANSNGVDTDWSMDPAWEAVRPFR